MPRLSQESEVVALFGNMEAEDSALQLSSVKNHQNPSPAISPVIALITVNESSVNFSKLTPLLRDEIFQNLGISKLLILRR